MELFGRNKFAIRSISRAWPKNGNRPAAACLRSGFFPAEAAQDPAKQVIGLLLARFPLTRAGQQILTVVVERFLSVLDVAVINKLVDLIL